MASGLGNVQLRVNPQVMRSQAEEVRRQAKNMQARFREVENIMSRTKNYWIGEAGDLHRKSYTQQKKDIDEMLKRLLEHPEELITIAGHYESAEATNVNTSQPLPGDVIE